MLMTRHLILPTPTRLAEPLPFGLLRSDVPDYLLSRSFRRRAGSDLPRRQALVALGASFASLLIPITAPAAGITDGIKVTIEALTLAKDVWELGIFLWGKFFATNRTEEEQTGNILLAILNERDRIENSQLRFFEVPYSTKAKFDFFKGPAARVRGDKTFQVASEIDSDEVSFQAV
jgi:hypothetical protein